mmetsp:Transcript_41300/g.92761  ORF Transcript_41300/g.92761 Transcript_41300/m.92761 type:complete len:222 (+) Transcript_41300:3-668(+)
MDQVEPEGDTVVLTSEGRLLVPYELPSENQELMSPAHWHQLAEYLSAYLRRVGAGGDRSNCCWFCCRRLQDAARFYAIHVYLFLFAVVFLSILATILIFQSKVAFVASVAYVAVWPFCAGCLLFALPNIARKLWVERRDSEWRHTLREELAKNFAVDSTTRQCYTFAVRWMEETDGYVLQVFSSNDVELAWPEASGRTPGRSVAFDHESKLEVSSVASTPR